MIRVAFCDNEHAFLVELTHYMESYQQAHPQQIEYCIFTNSFDLLAQMEYGIRFDILFLDVILAGENGIEIAKEIRELDKNVKIVFFASSADYALESYLVNASFYQLKPVRQPEFNRLMEKLIFEMEDTAIKCLILKCKNGIQRIPFSKIEYCEICNRTVSIHLINGKILECSMRFKELEDILTSQGYFIRTHRFFLVNLNYVRSISTEGILLENEITIPISHGKLKSIKNQCLEYFEQNE